MTEAIFDYAPSIGVLNEDFKKCPGCKCYFFTKIDMKKHLDKFGREDHEEEFQKVHRRVERGDEEESEKGVWSKSKYGDGEILRASKDTLLSRSIEQQGEVRMGMYLYTLSNDKQWIIKKIVME